MLVSIVSECIMLDLFVPRELLSWNGLQSEIAASRRFCLEQRVARKIAHAEGVQLVWLPCRVLSSRVSAVMIILIE